MEYHGQRYTFETTARLGGGGMAEVYLGSCRERPGVNYAIKVPLTTLPSEVRDLFLREAEAGGRVSSPHVVPVIDWGDNPPFIAFEYVEADTLAAVLRRRIGADEFWPLDELLELYLQLVSGMKAINQHVVHRDLKPENIFMADVAKISDFGIAKYVGEVTRSKTFKGWGTAPYMAPESFRLDRVDWEADQYSMGVVFFEIATLRRPFTGDWDELERQHLYNRPARITTIVRSCPERLATLVAHMLEKRPGDRFRSWDEIGQEVESLQRGVAEVHDGDGEDPLVHAAAEQLERRRTRLLEQERQQNELTTKIKEREELLGYWADVLFDHVKERIDKINEPLGEGVIAFQRIPFQRNAGRAQEDCTVSFLSAAMDIRLQTIPPEASEDILLWGYVDLTTNRRLWLGNLLLTNEPPPYGTWFQADLRVSHLMQSEFRPQDDVGGRYKVEGQERLVLAANWQALLFQRGERNVMSGINYEEKPLEFGALVEETLKMLVEDGNAEPLQRRPANERGSVWR
jgi:hypothetical protein